MTLISPVRFLRISKKLPESYIIYVEVINVSSQNIRCDKAEYIEDEYICWYTGKPCTITPLPDIEYCSLDYVRKEEEFYARFTVYGTSARER